MMRPDVLYKLAKQLEREKQQAAMERRLWRLATPARASPEGERSQLRRVQLVYYAVLSLYWLGSVLPAAILTLYMQARGLDLFQIGVVSGLAILIIVLLEVPTGGMADRVGRKPITLIAYLIKLLSTVILLFASSYPVFLLWAVLSGVSWALASGALDA